MASSRTILITGSSTGFGRRAAQRLANEGHTVLASMREASGRNAPHAEALRRHEGPGRISVIEIDVTNDASVQEAMDVVAAQVERLDVLVNNAGI